MDAIKKKMQAMKLEKENALDKAEQLEQKLRDTEETKARVRFFSSYIYLITVSLKWTPKNPMFSANAIVTFSIK